MKKILLVLVGALLIFQGAMSCEATEFNNIFSSFKNAIIKDVQDTVSSTVTTAANRAIDLVKLNQYKQQLAQKKQELADLEASNINFISKFFRRRTLKNEIKNLEYQIKKLEV